MPRNEDWSDGAHFIDYKLEKVNARIRAKTFKSMPKLPNENGMAWLTRVNIEYQKKAKKRNAYGRIT